MDFLVGGIAGVAVLLLGQAIGTLALLRVLLYLRQVSEDVVEDDDEPVVTLKLQDDDESPDDIIEQHFDVGGLSGAPEELPYADDDAVTDDDCSWIIRSRYL